VNIQEPNLQELKDAAEALVKKHPKPVLRHARKIGEYNQEAEDASFDNLTATVIVDVKKPKQPSRIVAPIAHFMYGIKTEG
jgi:hypothetical protein